MEAAPALNLLFFGDMPNLLLAAVLAAAGLPAAGIIAAPADMPASAVAPAAPPDASPRAETPASAQPLQGRLGPARKSVKLFAYGPSGRLFKLPEFLAFIARGERTDPPDPQLSGMLVTSPDEAASSKPILEQKGEFLTLSWERLPRIHLSLPWPVAGDGFSTVWLDKNGDGYSDGDMVFVNEEIAVTQYRRFKESLRKRATDWNPVYQPGAKARKAAEQAKELMARAHAERDAAARAQAFDAALQAVSLAWQKLLFEHGLQIAQTQRAKGALRFGLVIDEGIFQRLNEYRRVIAAIKRSGANWVRLVFRSNPDDFLYANLHSFNEYDSIIGELRGQGLRIMGTVLDTGQWPRSLTPQIYAERVKNLVFHYQDQIRSWEVGSELNGDWLGGASAPLPPDQVYRIYAAGAAKVKELDPALETVATLYWWDGGAPDREHSLFGWLKRYSREGFGRNLDLLAVSLQPDENPVGMAFEAIFERLHQELPDKRLMLGSLGYVDGDKLQGYWWLDADDVPAARDDLLVLFTTASCAMPRSLCGGFWWQTLEQMIPAQGKTTDLYRTYAKTIAHLGRR